MRKNTRSKNIPDALFYDLWIKAEKSPDKNEYIADILAGLPKKAKTFMYDNKITTDQFVRILDNIYGLSHLEFRQIVTMSGKRKSEIRDIFCMPIRTIEDWYSGKNRCPAYVRIMVMKQFHLLRLGRYIHLQSEVEHKKTMPGTYEVKVKHKKIKSATVYDTSGREAVAIPELKVKRTDKESGLIKQNYQGYQQEKQAKHDELLSRLFKDNKNLFR